MIDFFRRLGNYNDPHSLARQMRRKRFQIFLDLIADLPRPVRLVDLGGTEHFWETMEFTDSQDIDVTLVNLYRDETRRPNFRSVIGDARHLENFSDAEFDVVFSNSLIEHVGTWQDQQQAAAAMLRIGKRHFIQTPYLHFPIEPHYLVPFFQYLPLSIQEWIALHWKKSNVYTPDRAHALEIVRGIRLLNLIEMIQLFPHSTIYREKWGGLVKSLVAFGLSPSK
jgi:hypothetical protein